MIHCPACSSTIPKGSRFCPNCGVALSIPLGSTTGPYEPATIGSQSSASAPSQSPPSSPVDSKEEPRFTPGTVLIGRYRIVAALGKGGMGEVYRAEDLKLGQQVALKFLPPSLINDPDRLARLHREVRYARKVSHPMVCRVYDIGEVRGQTFLTMEYIDGEDLASLLRRIGRLPEDKAIQLARQLCAGLAAAHDMGILHCDLKPRNVMIDGKGRARITDFGLAVFVEEINPADIRCGTPHYMAPEQLAGKEVTVKSDLFALGLVLYEMFTGKYAFAGQDRGARDPLNSDLKPPSLSSMVPELDPAIGKIILSCLEQVPTRRPPSALHVAAVFSEGDPLTLAIAEGKTPSPELVAGAGKEGTISPTLGAVLLGAIAVGILAIALLQNQAMLHRLIPLHKSPLYLAERAESIVEKLGYPIVSLDRRFNFLYEQDYLNFIIASDSSPDRWARLNAEVPAAMVFWYRQSPDYMVPAGMGLKEYPGRVTPTDPPLRVSGMASVFLDPAGRLLEFIEVPPSQEEAASPEIPVDWKTAFEEAKLEWDGAAPTAPTWIPPVFSSQRAAWTTVSSTSPDVPVRVEGASYQGKVVFFKVVFEPWTRPDPIWESKPAGSVFFQYLFAIVFCLLILGGIWLARRNLRMGRGDLQGAFRLAGCLFVGHLICAFFAANHVPSFATEATWLMKAVGFAAFWAGSRWLMYVALEPAVRRRWPWRMVSWNRLLAGQFRNPLVGRDILVGALLGVFQTLTLQLHILVPRWLGQTPPLPLLIWPASFTNVSFYLLVELLVAIEDALQWFFLLFLLVLFVRKEWLAIGVAFLLALIYYLVQWPELPVLNVFFIGVCVAGCLFVTLRYGLLSLALGLYFCFVLYQTPINLDFSSWYLGTSLVYMLALLGLAVYGFLVSLGGRPLFRKEFFQHA
jgi:serine/threonine protein kinase